MRFPALTCIELPAGIEGEASLANNAICLPLLVRAGILLTTGGYSLNIYPVLNGSQYDYYISNSQFIGNYYGDPPRRLSCRRRR